ncbi:MAG: type VI secretion system tip protein VgrG [Holophagales bacterium]|nr:type VI secretion system tip protein VgrG [Holophagales bacterium]
MNDYLQQNRKLRVTTPLGEDTLLLTAFSGTGAISTLFGYRLEMLADSKTEISFDAILGQNLTIHMQLPDESSETHLNGLCVRFAQAGRDDTFTVYEAEIVPDVWKLTRKAQSRIFQRMTVPDILKEVFAGFIVDWTFIQTYEPRDYCVQYRETDWNFGARLMEEEGIRFFFRHEDGDHTMIVSDNAGQHPDLPGENCLLYEEVEGGTRDENRIWAWKKEQEIRPGKFVLWDHCFELPHKHLDAEVAILASVPVGGKTHTLNLPGVDQLELYDFPGEYAQRYDGVSSSGGDQAGDLQKIFQDNRRTVAIRMDEETTPAVVIRAKTNAKHLDPGYRFTVRRHFSGDGPYVVTSVRHQATFGAGYRSGNEPLLAYQNEVTCMPAAMPYRPRRTTPKPVVQGSQTAVVVGPSGEEIFTDKYGRVKVQFHWDRQGKNDPGSSCWIRVGTGWAGRNWGEIRIPRVGQEVLVDFLEGDPDQPIVVGSVYNSEMMPPYTLPANKTQSGVKSRSSLGGTAANYNELRFEDKKGSEEVLLHAEKDLLVEVEHDETRDVGHDRKTTIGNDCTTTIKANRKTTVQGNQDLTVQGNRTDSISGNDSETVTGNQSLTVTGKRDKTVTANETINVAANESLTAGGSLSVTSGAALSVTVGGSTTISSTGAVTISTVGALSAQASGAVSITAGGAATINVGGAAVVNVGAAATVNAGAAVAITAGGAVALTAGGAVSLTAPAITLTSGIVTCTGVLMATSVITSSVVGAAYTPGAGNIL